VEERWRAAISGERPGCLTHALRAAKWPYLAGLKANLAIYDSGLKARSRPALPTVSVGNLTLGGTGKTTTTRSLARELLARGVRPGIVLRGHRRKHETGPLLVADFETLLVSVDEAGDEATMLAGTVPGCPVGVGKRREEVIELLADTGAQVALLDDGYQYFRMARLINIALLDATVELSRARVFPAGYLREPLTHLRRATHVLLTHADLAPRAHVEAMAELARKYAPEAPVMWARHRPTGLYPLTDPAAELPVEYLRGKSALAVSAVGNPASFEGALLEIGARITGSVVFDDHHDYQPDDYRAMRDAMRIEKPDFIVVTEKDAVKLPPPPEDMPPVLALKVDLEIIEGADAWEAMLVEIENGSQEK